MAALILAINPGSSSKEYGLYEDGTCIAKAYYEKDEHNYVLTYSVGESDSREIAITESDFANALNDFIARWREEGNESQISAIGVRLVAPGRTFLTHHAYSESLRVFIEENAHKAPLHIHAVLDELGQAESLEGNPQIFVISDSAFHSTITHEARNYAIPREAAEASDIYRYGYHGLSVASVVSTLEQKVGHIPPNLIVCHLGSGASVTAVRDGKSFDTSMGYSPLEGLIMGTRSGTIDIEAALQLKQHLEVSDEELIRYLNRESGLLGLSGVSNDIRTLLIEKEQGSHHAAFALSAMAYRIRFYIGAYTALMNGLDGLIFTATAGVRSAAVRHMVCKDLSSLGISLDNNANQHATSDFGVISTSNSAVKVYIVDNNETREIAAQTAQLL